MERPVVQRGRETRCTGTLAAAEIHRTEDQKAQPGKETEGKMQGRGRVGTPRLDGRVGLGVVAFRFGFYPSGEPQTIAFFFWKGRDVKCIQLLSASEASLVLGKGSWDIPTMSLRARLPHTLGHL